MSFVSLPPTDFDERIVPDETEKGIVSAHLKRYVFAGQFSRSKQVLDAACGVGYGTYYLASSAERVFGVDRSQEAISYAQKRYSHPRAVYMAMDASALTFDDQSFDVVCSFETIEHLTDAQAHLESVRRVLKKNGLYLVSTPYVRQTTNSPGNSFHVQEWSPGDFEKLLGGHFALVRLYGQKRRQTVLHRLLQKADVLNLRSKIRLPSLSRTLAQVVRTTPFQDMGLEDLEIVENNFKGALWTIGVCSGPK